MDSFSFASSSDLHLPISVKINSLDGHQPPIPYSVLLRRPDLKHLGSNVNPISELYVTVQLWADNNPLSTSIQTSYKAFKTSRTWNEWLELPIKYSDIPASAQLAITIWDLSPCGGPNAVGHAVPFGGTTISLFDEDNTLRRGRQRCHVHRLRAADGLSDPQTPHIVRPDRRKSDQSNVLNKDKDLQELERLENLMKKREMGEIPEEPWLDQLVFRHMEDLQRKVSRNLNIKSTYVNGIKNGENDTQVNGKKGDQKNAAAKYEFDPGHFFLYIDFLRFDHPVVFTDHEYPAPPISTMQASSANVSSADNVQLKPPPEVTLGPGINDNTDTDGTGRLFKIYDPEIGFKENPVESKHRRLFRNQRSGLIDRDAKPNAKARDELATIIAMGPTEELSQPDKDLVWRFRHHLTRNKRALTKFVKSTNWSDPNEARQAVALLPRWTEIDVDDALELLGPTVVNPAVRAYAVDRLRKADDEELLIYLLQLVQALKFEKIDAPDENNATNGTEATTPKPEDDPSNTPQQDSSLARFLIARASKNFRLSNFLYWYLMVECSDSSPENPPQHRALYAKVSYDFMLALEATEEGRNRRKTLQRQGELITVLSKLSKDTRFGKEDRGRKIERLRKSMADPSNELLSFDPPLPLPIDPDVKIVSNFPSESNVFKSSLLPLLIHWKTDTGAHYPVIFKTGDDLRQDQLVIQIITLMDRLLRKENLDLKLTPYAILATSANAGCVQFVPSQPLAAIASKHKAPALLNYLKANNPDENAPLGVRREAMDTYVKSCAGYCIITYLLGVGDRHLDNLLLTPSGRFFHADFGYILGRDPKPFAPLMKLSKEMIEGMGGVQSQYYERFKQHCFTSFTALRKSSGLILNLFSLMVDANIPDIRAEPDKCVQKVRDRFRLEMRSEEEVVRWLEGLLEESVSAVFPAIIDRMHGFVQRFRT